MDEPLRPTDEITAEIEREYREFLAKLDLLKKQQEELIKEYREKLEQRKLSHLREQLNTK